MLRAFVVCLLVFPIVLLAQHTVFFHVTDSATQEPVVGARISLLKDSKGAITDKDGKASIEFLTDGSYTVRVTAASYEKHEMAFIIPLENPTLNVRLVHLESEGEEVIVEATRDNRTISTIPTRVEVLTEEIDEAAAMDPSKISHVITHSTGIQLQTTSATSNTANVRIQGLDGRYTQILKDGFPLYGGYSGSLSIMQIPPLDLKQIEYIKGSASTLYGGGAIAGLINLISKDPKKEETLLHLNYSSLGTTDLNAFYSRRDEAIGVTMLASQSLQQPYDADDDHFSDIPKISKINFNPKLFYYPGEGTKLIAGATFLLEDRIGGDLSMIAGDSRDSLHFYKETNYSTRINTQLAFEMMMSEDVRLQLKNGFSFFDRTLTIVPHTDSSEYRFGGKQVVSFSEASVMAELEQHLFIGGVNLLTDDFNEKYVPATDARNESNLIVGGFLQDTWTPSNFFSTELGFRGDYTPDYGFFALPRVSMLFRFTNELSSRLGGGLGYRLPSIFNQEAELLGYRGIAPLTLEGDASYDRPKAERSLGINLDFNYKTQIGEFAAISVNQLFFYTRLSSPLILTRIFFTPEYPYAFVNAYGAGQTRTSGFETAVKVMFHDFTLFVGYTFTQAENSFVKTEDVPLTPKHSLKGDLLYVLPGEWRIAVDYELKGSQTLSSGRRTRDLFTTGAVIERTIDQFVLFLNLENITDVRQTRYESLLSGPNNTPQFTEVWAPLDGFFINGGIKVTL